MTKTRQQRRAEQQAALKNSPWADVKTSPTARDLNRARYKAKKAEKARAASRILPDLASIQ